MPRSVEDDAVKSPDNKCCDIELGGTADATCRIQSGDSLKWDDSNDATCMDENVVVLSELPPSHDWGTDRSRDGGEIDKDVAHDDAVPNCFVITIIKHSPGNHIGIEDMNEDCCVGIGAISDDLVMMWNHSHRSSSVVSVIELWL